MTDQPNTPKRSKVEITDDMVERAAKAMFNEQVKSAQSTIAERQFDCAVFKSYLLGLRAESDRGLSVFMWSYMETVFEGLLSQELEPSIPGGLRSLFDHHGPLSSGRDKVLIAGALRWFSPTTVHNLEMLRRIRNRFAHEFQTLDFGDRVILGLVTSMHPVEERILRSIELKPEVTARTRFHVRAVVTLTDAIVDLLCAPVLISHGLPFALRPRFDDMPLNVRELLRASAETCLELVAKDPDFLALVMRTPWDELPIDLRNLIREGPETES
jgi:hypothetical protein